MHCNIYEGHINETHTYVTRELKNYFLSGPRKAYLQAQKRNKEEKCCQMKSLEGRLNQFSQISMSIYNDTSFQITRLQNSANNYSMDTLKNLARPL